MFNRMKVWCLVLALLVVGFITYIHWPAKASIQEENLGSALKKLQGATLIIRKGDSSAGAGKVAFVGADYIQSSLGTYYPFSAIVSASGGSTSLTIEVR